MLCKESRTILDYALWFEKCFPFDGGNILREKEQLGKMLWLVKEKLGRLVTEWYNFGSLPQGPKRCGESYNSHSHPASNRKCMLYSQSDSDWWQSQDIYLFLNIFFWFCFYMQKIYY